MSFLCKQISDNRWGIYAGARLLATVSDRATCEAIMANFQSARRELPVAFTHLKTGLDAETSVVEKNAAQSAVANGEKAAGKTASQRTSMMSDEELARVLNLKSLKVKELESAVLRAQKSQED